MRMPRLAPDALRDLVERALRRAGASAVMAAATAKALTEADAQGLSSHGVARVPQYAAHLRNGRAVGDAVAVGVIVDGTAAEPEKVVVAAFKRSEIRQTS